MPAQSAGIFLAIDGQSTGDILPIREERCRNHIRKGDIYEGLRYYGILLSDVSLPDPHGRLFWRIILNWICCMLAVE